MIDCEQSSFFLFSSSSRGKTSRTPVRGNLDFRAPVFAMSFRGLTNSRGKTGTARSLTHDHVGVPRSVSHWNNFFPFHLFISKLNVYGPRFGFLKNLLFILINDI